MFCPNCGRELSDGAAYCLGCGIDVRKHLKKTEGKVSALWWWLGFFLPLAGFLVWIFCNDSEPKKAKKAGIGAIVGTVLSFVLALFFYLFYFLFVLFAFYYN